MANYDFDIGILGGGAAGLTVASGAARFGAKTLLIEKEKELGGDCLHYGCVPSKTLIRTANIYHLMKNAEKYGLPHTDLKPVDFHAIAARIQTVINTIQAHDSKERFCKLGARVEFGMAKFIDEHSVRLNGEMFSAKKWVIATGSSPFIPPIEGINKTPYITNKELFSLKALPKSMIAIGGGPISIEMAQAFNRLGTKVTVVELADQILGAEDKDLAEHLMNILISEGITFHLGSLPLGTKDLGNEKEIIIKNAEGKTISMRAETILVAVGRKANLQGLGLEDISVERDKKGLTIDDRLRTNHKHIYVAGDTTGSYQFTHAAGYEGGIVLSNAILHLPRKVDYTYLPWCTYTNPELASIGMNEKRAAAADISYSVWTEEFRTNDRSLAEGEETGRIKLLLDEKEKPIGIQILGPRAGELISEWVAVMNGNVKLSAIASAIHPYPTLGEINKKVVGNFFSGKIFSNKVKWALKYFFNLKGRACE
ncbi:MAG: FAD-dependent oxidoreductase [Thermodesulfovibrionales bacterium]|jgi:pyruvate/2-oxoglutarate dehydrogenase complex dihydrolipoamide dehydrogenase (E3) component